MKFYFIFVVTSQLFLATRAIYDGRRVKISEIPYIVLVKNSEIFCSGALISNRHILTAAHCLRKSETVTVTIGSDNYFKNKEENPYVMVIKSNKTWMHEKFTLPSAVYDIGVIELPTNVSFSKAVRHIKVSTKKNVENDINDLEVITTGFGYPENSAGASNVLLYARSKLISLKECKKFKKYFVEDLNQDHICMSSIRGQPCDGDSGSPVISTKTRELIGIISYIKDTENGVDTSDNDCEANVPAVATRVSSYLNWISEKTGLKFE
ncbi:chymotrypsin-like [Chironomus tepperi]|uniref:chymotrypsin-like n=1 Tax=Chironomus tepperi TaxID=113505 RepID=UPI00391F5BE2